MSNGTRVMVSQGKYKGKYGEVVGVHTTRHSTSYSVRVDGVAYVQVYDDSELTVG